MTISDLQKASKQYDIKIIDLKNDFNMKEKLLEKNPGAKVYESDIFHVVGVILEPNEITGYLDVMNECCVILNYDDPYESKSSYKISFHHYIKFLDKGKIVLDECRLKCIEKCRREIQFSRFVGWESVENCISEFTLNFNYLNFSDFIIPDFNPSEIFPIYKRLISEKYKMIIPSIKHLKAEMKESKILFDVFNEDYPVVNKHNFSPFDYTEMANQMEKEIVKTGFKICDLENKLRMLNNLIRKIHYTYLIDKNVAILCKQFLIDNIN